MLTCSKTYRDIPMAHRAHAHPGHCAHLHGHNWAITLTFACRETDSLGFVVDFGGLRFVRDWIDQHLDHACVLSENDPFLAEAREMETRGLFKLHVAPNCSCEGLARHFHAVFDAMIRRHTEGRAWIASIEVAEDSRNSVRFEP